MLLTEEKLEFLPISDLSPNPRNARTHSKKQIGQIADSIECFGFVNPVLIDGANNVIAGHGRLAAAKRLKLKRIPCRRVASMTASQRKAYALADNKIALNAGWDEDLLAGELQELLEADLDFDLGVTGFDAGEIDVIVESPSPSENHIPEDDRIPDNVTDPRVTASGDLWRLGDHLLYCGDALKSDSYDRLMQGDCAQIVFADPPYNVPVDGHVGGSGRIRHREFAMAAGEMTKQEFTGFLRTAFEHCVSYSLDGSIHFHCMDWRHMREILEAGYAAYDELKNLCVWVKDNGGMGTFYRSRHELIFVFKKGRSPHVNNFGLGENGRYRTNVWNYRGATSGGNRRLETLALHPTVKPVAMIADVLRDCSRRGSLALDPFGGSGSTLIAAERTGRKARLLEIDPVYVDRAIRRWQQVANDDAIHQETGETFQQREATVRRAGSRGAS